MKLLDGVKVLTDMYDEFGIIKGMIGTVLDADIRWNSFYVCFQDQRVYDPIFMSDTNNIFKLKDDICHEIIIEYLDVFKDNHCSDKKN